MVNALMPLIKNTSVGRTGIEDWAAGLSPKKARTVEQKETKYTGVSYRLWMQPLFPILNPTMRINDICVGSDKLGHFLQQGLTYYGTVHAPGGSVKAAETESRESEEHGFGLEATGVLSNADQEANHQGFRFYEDLTANPAMTFDIGKYINRNWNEEVNPSFYEASVGPVVWRNLLRGSWTGTYGSRRAVVELAVADDSVSVSGQFGYTNDDGSIAKGAIQNARITHTKNNVGAITGVAIDLEWAFPAGKGKGKWSSSNESTLQGSWEGQTPGDKGATWNLTKSRTPVPMPESAAAKQHRQKSECWNRCEAEFDRCLKTSTSGPAFCLARRTSCYTMCGQRPQK
jgi:hypothetical protein